MAEHDFHKWTGFAAADLAGMLSSNPAAAVPALAGFAARTRPEDILPHAEAFARDPRAAAFFRAFADAIDLKDEQESSE